MLSDTALLESKALKLCSIGFLYPDESWIERFGRLASELSEAQKRLEKILGSISLSSLQEEHFLLFGSNPLCPLELANHLSENPFERVRIQAQMAGFYRAFGLEFTEGVAPDNLSVCFEFLAYLALKELNALNHGAAEALEVTRSAVKNYVAEFLLPGLENFKKKLLDSSGRHSEFYTSLTEFAWQSARCLSEEEL